MKALWSLVRHVVEPITRYFCCLYFLSLKITSNLKMGLNLNLIWQICLNIFTFLSSLAEDDDELMIMMMIYDDDADVIKLTFP